MHMHVNIYTYVYAQILVNIYTTIYTPICVNIYYICAGEFYNVSVQSWIIVKRLYVVTHYVIYNINAMFM